ncbi:hypothetical protein HDU67_005578 [Dinochytrium kinnereticum]|nr:hypothetical protein HDU67_005578 [Dinochytrium kinnereticum]
MEIGPPETYRKIQNETGSQPITNEPTREFSLSGMTYGKNMGRQLFLWGTTIFYSPDGGISVFEVVEIPTGLIVASLTTSVDGSFSYSLSDNSIWYGQTGTTDVFQVRPPRIGTGGVELSYVPLYDHDGYIVEVAIIKDGTGIRMQPEFFDLNSVLAESELITGLHCPYSDIEFSGTFGAENVRDTSLINTTSSKLPHTIFLDRLGEYKFSMDITAAPGVTDRDLLQIAYSVHGNNSVFVDYKRSILRSGKIRYNFTIKDLGLQSQSLSGETFATSVLNIHVVGSHLSCVSATTLQEPITTSLVIYSGCAPFQKAQLDLNATSYACPDSTLDIPCIFFDNASKFRFLIQDELTGINSVFMENYRLRIIGGSTDLETISNYSESFISTINPNFTQGDQRLIWTAAHEDDNSVAPIFNINRSEIKWGRDQPINN